MFSGHKMRSPPLFSAAAPTDPIGDRPHRRQTPSDSPHQRPLPQHPRRCPPQRRRQRPMCCLDYQLNAHGPATKCLPSCVQVPVPAAVPTCPTEVPHEVPTNQIHTPVTQATTAFVSSSPLPSFVPSSRVACDQIKSRRARARAALLVLRGLVPVSLVFPVPFALAWSLSLLRFPPSEPPQHQARSPWARPPPPCSLVRTCAFPVAARRVLRWLLRSLCVARN